MTSRQLQAQSHFAPSVPARWLWHKTQQLATQTSQLLSQLMIISDEPWVSVHCADDQTSFHVHDPYDGRQKLHVWI